MSYDGTVKLTEMSKESGRVKKQMGMLPLPISWPNILIRNVRYKCLVLIYLK